MSRFCSKCGSAVGDSERFCSVCGAPADQQPAPVNNEPIPPQGHPAAQYPEAPASAGTMAAYDMPYVPPKKSKKGLIIGLSVAAVVVVAAVVLLIVLLGGNGGAPDELKKVFTDLKNGNCESYVDKSYYFQFGSYKHSSNDRENAIKEMEEVMKDRHDLQMEIYGTVETSQEEMDAIKKELEDYSYRDTDDIQDIRYVMTKTAWTFDDGKKGVSYDSILTIKVDGKWYFEF